MCIVHDVMMVAVEKLITVVHPNEASDDEVHDSVVIVINPD